MSYMSSLYLHIQMSGEIYPTVTYYEASRIQDHRKIEVALWRTTAQENLEATSGCSNFIRIRMNEGFLTYLACSKHDEQPVIVGKFVNINEHQPLTTVTSYIGLLLYAHVSQIS